MWAWIVCFVLLFRSWKTLSPRQRWSLTGTLILFLFCVVGRFIFELEVLNQFEDATLTLAWIVCVMLLFRSWKTLPPRQRWSLTGTLIFLCFVVGRLIFELEVLNQVEEFLLSVLFYVALPFLLLIKAFRFKRLWLKIITILLTILVIPVSLFCFLWYVTTIADHKLITQFDSLDGSVYVIREDVAYGFHSDRCLTMTQHQRITPGLLALKKTFDTDKDIDDKKDIDDNEWFGCSVHDQSSIDSIKTYFRAK
jgi:hypothetical protein